MSEQALKLKPGVVEVPLPRQTTVINFDFDYLVGFAKEKLSLSNEDALSFAQEQFADLQEYLGSLSPDDVLLTAQRPAEHWVVGRCLAALRQRAVWDLVGVFDTEDKAVRACQGESDFVMPVPVNALLPQSSGLNARAYYPLLTGPESENNDSDD